MRPKRAPPVIKIRKRKKKFFKCKKYYTFYILPFMTGLFLSFEIEFKHKQTRQTSELSELNKGKSDKYIL